MLDDKINEYFSFLPVAPPQVDEKMILQLLDEKARKRQLIFFSFISCITTATAIGVLVLLWPAISAAVIALPMDILGRATLAGITLSIITAATFGLGLMSMGLLKENKKRDFGYE